jgi:DNA-binding IclR family transcriptional regulator
VTPTASAGEDPATGSRTLERGLRVLDLLAERPGGLSVTEIATALATHRAGVYRLLAPLQEHRLVHRDDDGRWTLGAGLIGLASRVRSRLQEVALPELRRLADDLGATAALTLRDDEEAVVAIALEPRSTDMHLAYRRGLRHRLDQGAAGIAILAALPPRAGEREEVVTARARGWARTSGELLPGATGVAAPIVADGHPAEASVSAVWIESHDEEAAAASVVATAGRIAAALV